MPLEAPEGLGETPQGWHGPLGLIWQVSIYRRFLWNVGLDVLLSRLGWSKAGVGAGLWVGLGGGHGKDERSRSRREGAYIEPRSPDKKNNTSTSRLGERLGHTSTKQWQAEPNRK